jgi:hypothetical protein
MVSVGCPLAASSITSCACVPPVLADAQMINSQLRSCGPGSLKSVAGMWSLVCCVIGVVSVSAAVDYDVVVYGSTPAGIAAATAAQSPAPPLEVLGLATPPIGPQVQSEGSRGSGGHPPGRSRAAIFFPKTGIYR